MKIMQVTCGNCAGYGYSMKWEDNGSNTLQCKKYECEACNGKGYSEHAVFSVEEAKAILKHCGLSTES